MIIHKTYLIIHPQTLEPIVIGDTILKLKVRLWNYIHNSKTNKRVKLVIDGILSKGLKPLIVELNRCGDEFNIELNLYLWQINEILTIAHYKSIGWNLLNKFKGGEGGKGGGKRLTPEEKEERKEYQKEYQKKYYNTPKGKAHKKAYREAHKKERKTYIKAYYEAHKAERKAYYEAHKKISA